MPAATTPTWRARFRGCLVGGAVGDALGAPIEFMSLREIRTAYGPDGLKTFVPAYGRLGAITDDTQMTMFTAEGLIRAWVRQSLRGVCHPPGVVHYAYLRWLKTQGGSPKMPDGSPMIEFDGWLIELPSLHARRAPGNTCLSALQTGELGARARNNSKGCGAVMRIAPAGMLAALSDTREDAFQLAVDIAGLTHGHPSGHLSAGYLALLMAGILDGREIRSSSASSLAMLRSHPDSEEVVAAVERALELADKGSPDAAKVESLGQGWVAEEALAIGLYCALTAASFEDGVLRAVNHGGDSDSTGSIAGNILGSLLGLRAIPPKWTRVLELRAEIQTLADDLYGVTTTKLDPEEAWQRYPGW